MCLIAQFGRTRSHTKRRTDAVTLYALGKLRANTDSDLFEIMLVSLLLPVEKLGPQRVFILT